MNEIKGPPLAMHEVIYNFIIPDSGDCPVEDFAIGECPCSNQLCLHGEFVWSQQTYCYLRESGMKVQLSLEVNPAAINLAHGNVLRALEIDRNCFCVSLQADYPQYPLAQYHIVQNREQVGESCSYIPHWPLPGQIPRNPERIGVKKVAYQGARNFSELDESRLQHDLQKHGIAFEILDPEQWCDLRDVDVLVGVRQFGRKRFRRKPPTKLINAWHAGIPFIGGWDSAYSQIAEPGRDYLRVSSYREMLSVIVRLKNDPALYRQLVEAGWRQASFYTKEAIVARWKQVLEMKVIPAYQTWKSQPDSALEYHGTVLKNAVTTATKSRLQWLYRVPGVKRLRDRFYDPS